jgi:2-enoate reductase
MLGKFHKLFEPGYIGKLEIPNRIVMPPMFTGFADIAGGVTQRHINYYAARAKGGVGLIIVEVSKVEGILEPQGTMPYLSADSDFCITALSDLTEAVHDYGARIALQLNAGLGRQSRVVSLDIPPISASDIPSFFNPSVRCHALTHDEIKEITAAFGRAAARAKMAGFDMVEINGNVGQLLDQFMSKVWNKRTDEYGGDVDGRMRFTLEILDAVRGAVGPDFPISLRISAEHGLPGGRKLEETKEITHRLETAGFDAIHVNAGCYETIDLIFSPIYKEDACLAWAAAAMKEMVDLPVIAVGKITPESGEALIESGQADFVAIGRGLIADPDLPVKVRTGRIDHIRPCIRCNERCIGRLWAHRPLSCSVNPLAGEEGHYEIRKAEKRKKVLVIGGGPAGMEAARVAGLRGHQVTLLEKDAALGGQLRAAAAPPFKKEYRQLIDWWAQQLDNIGVEIYLNETATIERVGVLQPDAIVVATGAKPMMPDLPGLHQANVVSIIDHHLNTQIPCGDRIIVAGGGLSGCEAALELAQKGKNVTIVEMRPDVASDMNAISRMTLLSQLTAHGVVIMTQHKVKEFRSDGIMALNSDNKEVFLVGDLIILAMGVRADNELAKTIKDAVEELYIIGDCMTPAKVGEAVRSGFVTGLRI